jgi:hypothetical protein
VNEGEIAVSQNDFGLLVEEYVRKALNTRFSQDIVWTDQKLRGWWPKLGEYHQRHILCDIEVAIALDKPPRYDREPLRYKEVWVQFVKDLRPGKSPYTVDYRCGKCRNADVKLWRGVHGCPDKDGHELLCASCLAPKLLVDAKGKAPDEFVSKSDQIHGWLPAIPVDDTYWGYTSVPSQDVEWWRARPTYSRK